jgi:hypothetical protein
VCAARLNGGSYSCVPHIRAVMRPWPTSAKYCSLAPHPGKNLFDARRKLRASMATAGHPVLEEDVA